MSRLDLTCSVSWGGWVLVGKRERGGMGLREQRKGRPCPHLLSGARGILGSQPSLRGDTWAQRIEALPWLPSHMAARFWAPAPLYNELNSAFCRGAVKARQYLLSAANIRNTDSFS